MQVFKYATLINDILHHLKFTPETLKCVTKTVDVYSSILQSIYSYFPFCDYNTVMV